MQEAQMSDQAHENVAGQVMDDLGIAQNDSPLEADSDGEDKDGSQDLPKYAKERIGRQEKRHQREMRELRNQVMAMQQSQQPRQQEQDQPLDPYTQQPIQPGSVEEQIHKAVNMALQAKDMQERHAREAEKVAHVQKQYQDLQDKLDTASDKYDDFDKVVRSSDVPFTESMRDTALLLPNAAEVLYKLGKNPSELKRISTLHPLDQAKEMVRLSASLMGDSKSQASMPKTIGQIKNTPSSSSHVNDSTSVGELRRKMKANWK